MQPACSSVPPPLKGGALRVSGLAKSRFGTSGGRRLPHYLRLTVEWSGVHIFTE